MSLHPVGKRRRTCPAMVEEPGDNIVQFGKDCVEHSTWASQYPVAAAHLNNRLRASYVLGRDCLHVAPFASHFQTTPLSLTENQGKSRGGWGAVEAPAELSMRIVGVGNFEAFVKSPPPVPVPLEVL